jgi:hypothetical protein
MTKKRDTKSPPKTPGLMIIIGTGKMEKPPKKGGKKGGKKP